MIRRLFRSLSGFSATLFVFACIFLGAMIKVGDFPQILMPSHDYEYVLENGLKEGQHIKGEIFYSLGSFASKESYTEYEDSRTGAKSRTTAKTTGYYYMIPVGEGGMAAVYMHKDDLDAMDALTEETYNYLNGGEIPQTEVHFEGVAVKMEKNLAGLEGAFRDQLEYMGYADSEVEEMLATYSDGECLVLEGPADMSVMYVMMAVVFLVFLISILLIIRNYRKELAYDRMRENGTMKPDGATKVDMSGTYQTTYYVNK